MITRSTDYVESCRETAARSKTLHDLALGGAGKEALTAAIHQRIVEEVGLGPGDDLVDVGCGEGRRLHLAAKIGVHSAIGFLATDEEVAPGQSHRGERTAGLQRSASIARCLRLGHRLQQRLVNRSPGQNPAQPARDASHREAGRPHFHW